MRGLLAAACLLGLLSARGFAADEPELDFVYPAGGAQGSEFEIEVGGTLSAITQGILSGEGVKVTLVGAAREVVLSNKGRPVVTVVPNRYRFKVTVEPTAATGLRALRVGTAYRWSEPLLFEIAALPEAGKPITNRLEAVEARLATIPASVNGRVYGKQPERHVFQARQGMVVVAYTDGRLLPRGGFRPSLAFLDAAGQRCEGVALHREEEAPVAVFEVPADGEYALAVSCGAGAPGPGAVYRIRLGELPLVTGFAPLGARLGDSLNVRLEGANLSQRRVRLFTGGKGAEHCLEALTDGALALSGLRFDLTEEAEVSEREPNSTEAEAQPLELPCVVNGNLDEAGGRDLYRFSGTKGEKLYVDVRAASLGTPLKARVEVRDARGSVVAAGAYETRDTLRAALDGRDPSVAVTLPEDGAYWVEVSDIDGRSGPLLAYRLRIGPPQPDFRLWMRPATLNIPSDGSALVTLYVTRLHGYEGEIRVDLEYPPLSIASEGGVVPAAAVTSRMTVSTEGLRYPKTIFGLALTGTAAIQGREVRRPVTPLVYRRSRVGLYPVETGELTAWVGRGARALRVDALARDAPVDPRIPMPVKFAQPVALNTREPVALDLLSATLAKSIGLAGVYEPVVVWPPRGLTVKAATATNRQERAGVLLTVNPKVFQPGQTGHFILGCRRRDDTNAVTAVTQSVPFVIR